VTREPRWQGPATRGELYPAFDDTLTTGLEDTVKTLRVLRERVHSEEEEQRWQFKAVDDLTTEMKSLRKEVGNLVRALDKKASITTQAKFEKSLSDRLDARIDRIRSIAMWAIGLLFTLAGLLKVFH
jgi:hypothetical protein